MASRLFAATLVAWTFLQVAFASALPAGPVGVM